MPIAVSCPACGYSRSVPDEFAGKQGKCPKCGAAIRVPTPTATPPAPSAAKPTPPAGSPPMPRAARLPESAAPAQAKVIKQPPPLHRPAAPAVTPPVSPPEEVASLDFLSSAQHEPPQDDATNEAEGMAADWLESAGDKRAVETTNRARRSSRGKSSPTKLAVPKWAIAAGVLGLLAVVGIVVAVVLSSGENPVVAKKSKPAATKKVKDKEANDAADKPKRPSADAPLEDIFAWIKPGIVLIEVFSGDKPAGMGSGFIVDDTGLIATNYHVTSAGDRAFVKFTDDRRVEVAGYAALKPEWDLAILQLQEKPNDVRVLNLIHDSRPREASRVIAVGSPLGREFVPSSGIVSRVVQANDLEGETRAFLRRQTGFDEQFWIEHDAQIAPGNSGGPLFNQAGDVIGVNTWVQVNQFGRNGYAIWAWYVHDLLKKKYPQVEPLAKHRAVEATRTLAVGDVNADELRQDFTQLEASDWKFADGAARQTLERFSRGICVGRRAQKLGQNKALEPLVGELLGKLYSRTWSSTEQLSGINQPFIDHPPQAGQGCCVVGTIFGRPTQSGATILLIKLLGSDKMIAGISLPGETLAAGDKPVLLFGIASQNSIPYATPADGRIDIPVLEMAVCATLGKVQQEKKSAE